MKAKWQQEKEGIQRLQEKREQLEKLRRELEQAENEYDLNRAAELRHGKIPFRKRIKRIRSIKFNENKKIGYYGKK